MGLLNILTPKNIILDSIKKSLEGQNINNMTLIFNTIDDAYSIMLKKSDNSNLKLDLEQNEINTIKKILINRIRDKYVKTYDKKVKSVIIQINMITDKIELFIQDPNNEVFLFDYQIL